MSEQALRAKLIRMAHAHPEFRAHILPLITAAGAPRAAAWENLPPGWTQESVQKMWDTMTGDVKHKITKCMEQMQGKVDDTGAFCGSLASQVGYRSAADRTAEWKGWTEDMPVQVVTRGRTTVFPNLAAAREVHPSLDPRRNTSDFTWAMRGEVRGRPAIRFENWPAYKDMSRDASLLRRAAIQIAHTEPNLRPFLLPLLSKRG